MAFHFFHLKNVLYKIRASSTLSSPTAVSVPAFHNVALVLDICDEQTLLKRCLQIYTIENIRLTNNIVMSMIFRWISLSVGIPMPYTSTIS